MGANTVIFIRGKIYGDDNPQYRQAAKYMTIWWRLFRNNRGIICDAQRFKSLRLRYGNIDIAVNANGVSGDYFNVYGMSNTFNAVHGNRIARR